MSRLFVPLVALSLAASPARAVGLGDETAGTRPGAFVGLTLRAPIGRSDRSRPRASLAFAPTQTRILSDGTLRTRVGEGVALGFDGNAKPTLTVAGAPLNCSKRRQQSVSSVGWVAVGVATVTLAAVGFALWIDEIEDNSD